jgi:hypothetical protein
MPPVSIRWPTRGPRARAPPARETRRRRDGASLEPTPRKATVLEATAVEATAVEATAAAAPTRSFDSSRTYVLVAQGNIACAYVELGRDEEAVLMRRDVYSGWLKLNGEENGHTLLAANNYAASLNRLQRFEEAKALLRKTIPVARRVLGEENRLVLKMRRLYANALYGDPGATLDDLRKAVTTLEDAERIARRVLGGAHPTTVGIERRLREARAALRAREASV